MVLTISALAAAGTVICLVICVAAMRVLGGGVRETLFFFGIAERPVRVPPRAVAASAAPRERRPGHGRPARRVHAA